MSELGEFEENVAKSEVEEVAEEEADAEAEGEVPEDKEMLFLIEFLVDTLCVNTKNLNTRNIDPCMLNSGQTCIELTFLNFPTMNICEKDLAGDNFNTDEMIKFNAGKSLMFALAESQFMNPPPIYLDVSAFKMMPHASPMPRFTMGMTKICLSELFKQVFDKIYEKPDQLPLSKSIKDKYPMMGSHSRKPTAEITIYIRLSCLGQNVVTEFQRGGDECEPFLFKNKESNKVYECKPKDDAEDDESQDICPPCPGWGDSGEKQKTCFADQYQSGPVEDEEEFEEFGTDVHGHSLTIKIQKSQKKSNAKANSAMCLCNGGGGKGGGAGNQIMFQVPQDQNLCKSGRADNQAKVQNLKGCENGNQVLQVQQGEESEDKDIFVLRIGKKGEVNGKGKLELELRTPKQKLDRTPKGPRMIDREAQTDKEEGAKKGKGKKK